MTTPFPHALVIYTKHIITALFAHDDGSSNMFPIRMVRAYKIRYLKLNW